MKAHTLIAAFSMSCCVTAAYAAETYTIDPSHTSAVFVFEHPFSKFYSKVPVSSGTVVLDRAQKTGSVDLTLDINTMVTGVPEFDKHLRTADFFDVEKSPTATFKSHKLTFKGDALASVSGDLTVKGNTKPVTLQVTYFKCGQHHIKKVPACGANATATIKRSDFGLGKYVEMIPDNVEIIVEVEALAQPAAP